MSVNSSTKTGLSEVLKSYETDLVSEWVKEQSAVLSPRGRLASEADIRKECAEFIGLAAESDRAARRRRHRIARLERRSGDVAASFAEPRGARLQPFRDGLVCLFAQEAAVRPAAARARRRRECACRSRHGRRPNCWTSSDCTRPKSTKRRGKRSFGASKRTCSSSRRRS